MNHEKVIVNLIVGILVLDILLTLNLIKTILTGHSTRLIIDGIDSIKRRNMMKRELIAGIQEKTVCMPEL